MTKENAAQTGAQIHVCRDPKEAIDGCGHRLHGCMGEHGL